MLAPPQKINGFYSHISRRGDVYYLCQKLTSKDNLAYYFVKKPKPEATPVALIPEGYEIYETPDDAQPFLRKPVPSLITELEWEFVKQAVQKQANVLGFTVERECDALVVYTSDFDPHESEEVAAHFGVSRHKVMAHLAMRSRYTKMMRFQLCDASKRLFSAYRWCFLGSIDDWFSLDYNKPLPTLVNKYVKHLGRESFFELS
jgi:hypothetical protein